MDALGRVREICLGLPEVSERVSHGEPCWFYKGKRVVCMFDDHHHGADRVAVWVPCPAGVAAGLVESADRFFVPPYVGVKGWVGVVLDGGTDWDEIRGLIEVAWVIVSGKK